MTTADLGPWRPLHPDDVAHLLDGLGAPWWIAGGWALDLHLGRQTREHGDTDVEMLRRDAPAVRAHLVGWDLHLAASGELTPWCEGDELPGGVNSLWCRPAPDAPWALQLMLAPTLGDLWLYRRCPRVTRPVRELGARTPAGVPYLAPEIQLLYKCGSSASAPLRPKDHADLAGVAPTLSATERRWLRTALATASPGHAWLSRLAE